MQTRIWVGFLWLSLAANEPNHPIINAAIANANPIGYATLGEAAPWAFVSGLSTGSLAIIRLSKIIDNIPKNICPPIANLEKKVSKSVSERK